MTPANPQQVRLVTNRIRPGMLIQNTNGIRRTCWIQEVNPVQSRDTIAAWLTCKVLEDGRLKEARFPSTYKVVLLMTATAWRGDEVEAPADIDYSFFPC